jgi:succinate dehydrogenase / fumarate reductase cytochrome b subunit
MSSKSYDNHLGIKGWALGGAWSPERYLYTLHRVTGLGILSYFLLHILVTTSRAFGPAQWNALLGDGGFLRHPVFVVGEFLVLAAFGFHAANGVRLILIELGFAVGRPIEPVYPYKTSLHASRFVTVVLMLAGAAFIVLGGLEFLRH